MAYTCHKIAYNHFQKNENILSSPPPFFFYLKYIQLSEYEEEYLYYTDC